MYIDFKNCFAYESNIISILKYSFLKVIIQDFFG